MTSINIDSRINHLSSDDLKILAIIINKIWKRLNDEEIKKLSFIERFDKLTHEFPDFADNYTGLFRIITSPGDASKKKQDFATIASVLFHRKKYMNGETTIHQCTDMLTKKYFPEHLQKEFNKRRQEMIDNGEYVDE